MSNQILTHVESFAVFGLVDGIELLQDEAGGDDPPLEQQIPGAHLQQGRSAPHRDAQASAYREYYPPGRQSHVHTLVLAHVGVGRAEVIYEDWKFGTF